MKSPNKRVSVAGLLIALGIIYGDIGTSPLYTLQTILTEGGGVDKGLVFGSISCIFWTLTLQTTFKYIFITLQEDNHGEGVSKDISRSKIIGIDFVFQGTGSVDYVKLTNGKVSFDDEF